MDPIPRSPNDIVLPAAVLARSPNYLLASLPEADFEMLRPHLQTVELVQDTVLIDAGETLKRVYFPHSGVISLVVALSEGNTVEVAMVGRDSVFGASAALDGRIALTKAVIQLPGLASTLDVGRLRAASETSVAFRTTLIRHEQAMFVQAQQSAACNVSHPVSSRLTRWLLRARDLTGSDSLPLTQEFLAEMMGVQRNSVSIVAQTLQQAGVIRYSRGHIEILSVDGLKDAACECYATVKEQYDRLLDKDDK
jgi:CRP-like cAMP-binding protein